MCDGDVVRGILIVFAFSSVMLVGVYLMYYIRSELFVFLAIVIADSLCVFVLVLVFSCAADVVLGVENLPALFVCSSICLLDGY